MGHFWELVGFGTLIYWDRDTYMTMSNISITVLYDSSVLNFLNLTIWQITPLLLKQQKIKITLKHIENKLEMSMKTFLMSKQGLINTTKPFLLILCFAK